MAQCPSQYASEWIEPSNWVNNVYSFTCLPQQRLPSTELHRSQKGMCHMNSSSVRKHLHHLLKTFCCKCSEHKVLDVFALACNFLWNLQLIRVIRKGWWLEKKLLTMMQRWKLNFVTSNNILDQRYERSQPYLRGMLDLVQLTWKISVLLWKHYVTSVFPWSMQPSSS